MSEAAKHAEALECRQERLVSAEELAAELGVSRTVIYRMARNHEIPFYRFGTLKRFSVAEVKAIARNPL